MTIHAEILGGTPPRPIGWVEVDPFDYEYTGPDPDGEIESYLSDVGDGTITYSWPVEDDVHTGDYAPDLKIVAIKKVLKNFDPIWYVEMPHDFEVETITYG